MFAQRTVLLVARRNGLLVMNIGQAGIAIHARRHLIAYNSTLSSNGPAFGAVIALLRLRGSCMLRPRASCLPSITELAARAQVLNWNSHRIEEAVSICMADSRMVAETHAAIKSHLARVKAILVSWVSKLIVERKPGQVSDRPSCSISGSPLVAVSAGQSETLIPRKEAVAKYEVDWLYSYPRILQACGADYSGSAPSCRCTTSSSCRRCSTRA